MTAAVGHNPHLLELLRDHVGAAEAVCYLERMNDGYVVFTNMGFANGHRSGRGDGRIRRVFSKVACVVARVVEPKQEGDRGFWPRRVRTIWAGDVRSSLIYNGGSFGVEGLPAPQWGRLLRRVLAGEQIDVPFVREPLPPEGTTTAGGPISHVVGFWGLE